MGDSQAPREAARPRRESSGGGAPYSGQNQQRHDEDVQWIRSYRENHGAPERLTGEGARVADRRLSAPPQVVHQRHMPVGTQKFHIPRKTKEKLALFQPLSCESREYEDMLTILTSGYLDSASAGSFSYSQPRLVHSETLEKEFVEKRKELKADGRTEKELEESYCFLLCDSFKLQILCEKGLFVGQSRITVLGNPQKGVYLSRCSDLLQLSPFTPGASGEILIFKVIKGKVKSIYENMKNLLDPTPRYDSHLSKSISKITSVMSYRAFELTQHYFYEYSFDELRERPRQVCPYAVVSFQFKGKDMPLTPKPMAPLRLNSQSSDKSQEHAQFTVWSGDLVKDNKVLFQISLQSSSPPFLPHKLPERLEMKWVMRWDQATRRLPQSLFSYNLYSSSQEVVKDGFYCSLLEVVDRNRSMTSVTKLLLELETKAVALVTPLTERGFLFILSSVQMALAHERGENWKRSLQALFVFPETRCSKSTPQCTSEPSPDLVTADSVMPGMNHFVPALHFALGKARTNPPPELSTGVEQQAREYLNGIKEGVLRPYPVGQYDAELEQAGRQYPVPIMHRLGLDSCLQPYLCGPAQYLLLLSRVRAMVQQLCACPQKPLLQHRVQHSQGDQKMQQLIDLVLSCKRNAEREVQSEMKSGARKRKMVEQETAQRTIKHLKASQELQHLNAQNNTEVASSSPGSLTSLIGSVGLKDTDLRDEGSELAAKLLSLLTSLNQTATNQSTSDPRETGPKESSPFEKLAVKLGLPTNCDIDLRKQDDFEGGSVSSQEGFSPVSSFSGDPRSAHRDQDKDRDRGLDQNPRKSRRAPPTVCEKEEPLQPEIPWILIPITGLPLKHYTSKDKDLPRDPRVHQLVSTALPMEMITTATATSSCSPTPFVPCASSSPDPSPPASPSQCPSPDPSPPPSRCPSPELEPPSSSLNPSPRSSPWPGLEPRSSLKHEEMFNDPWKSEEIPVSRDTAAEPPPETPITLSPVACTSTALLSPRPPTPAKPVDLKEEDMRNAETVYRMSPPLPLQDIDSIVNRHQDSFRFDVQRILENQHVTYTFSQSPHSTSQPEHTASTTPILQFSQYVSFYHPCPPVQRYVSSLQTQITGVLNDYENNWTPNIPDITTTTDATSTPDLASRISEFVASIRAANNEGDVPESRNWQTDSEQEVATSSMDCDEDLIEKTIQNNVRCSDIETDLDISNNGRRQVQFGSNHIEICIRNEPVAHSSHDRRDIEDVGDLTPASPPGNSDQNALNSLINQLQPEVFTTLVEIIKDIKRNTQHYYIHCTEEDDYTNQQIRAQLSQQSYIEQSPVVFLNQEQNPKRKLLVIIKNQDIAAHIHQIPELLSLKRSPLVQFLGVDKADDLRNHTCCELFASGGQVLSDEMVLNPDFVSHEKLSALLSVLEKHSSPENLWRWKVHCKTHKKLKEQSRFRRDAASLLEVLMSFQKNQIVEFLPHHKCDMSQGPELLDCAVELQRMYTSFRHTLLLTENRPVNSSGGGVIVCGIDEFLRDFRKLVGYHDDDVQEPIRDEPQSTEDPSQSGLVPSEDLVSGCGLGSIPLHSEQDFEVLHRAISQLRAERQQQLRDNQSDIASKGQGAVSTTDESASDLTTSVTTTEQKPCTPPTAATMNDSTEAVNGTVKVLDPGKPLVLLPEGGDEQNAPKCPLQIPLPEVPLPAPGLDHKHPPFSTALDNVMVHPRTKFFAYINKRLVKMHEGALRSSKKWPLITHVQFSLRCPVPNVLHMTKCKYDRLRACSTLVETYSHDVPGTNSRTPVTVEMMQGYHAGSIFSWCRVASVRGDHFRVITEITSLKRVEEICAEEEDICAHRAAEEENKVSNSEDAQLTPGRKAVAATLDLIHSTLHLTNEDWTKDQTRVSIQTQVQNTDSIQDRRSPATQICAIEEATNMTTAPTEQNRYPETQVTIGWDKSLEVQNPHQVETQLSMDCKKSPEAQIQKAVETMEREEPTTSSGSQGSSVSSESQRGVTVSGKDELATTPLHPPASNESLSQSKVEQEKTKTANSTPERTKRKRKRRGNVKQDDPNKINISKKPGVIQLATATRRKLNHWTLNNPNLWDTIGFVREGGIPKRPLFQPYNEEKYKDLVLQSTLRKVVQSASRAPLLDWCPARVVIYDMHEGPWALVEKVHGSTLTPVVFLFGQYSTPINQRPFVPQMSYQPFYEDGSDMMMYF